MNKAKTGKLLSAAALANMAVVGFAAAPAGAAAHTAGNATGRVTATGLESHGFVKSRGFVPHASKGVRPFSEGNCNGDMCFSLHGGGHYVSYTQESFFGVGGCHIPWVSVWEGTTRVENIGPGPYVCPGSQYRVYFNSSWPVGTRFCGHFQNVPGNVCEPVR